MENRASAQDEGARGKPSAPWMAVVPQAPRTGTGERGELSRAPYRSPDLVCFLLLVFNFGVFHHKKEILGLWPHCPGVRSRQVTRTRHLECVCVGVAGTGGRPTRDADTRPCPLPGRCQKCRWLQAVEEI